MSKLQRIADYCNDPDTFTIPNWEQYALGGELQTYCVFCNNMHHGSYVVNLQDPDAKDSDYFMQNLFNLNPVGVCSGCSDYIRNSTIAKDYVLNDREVTAYSNIMKYMFSLTLPTMEYLSLSIYQNEYDLRNVKKKTKCLMCQKVGLYPFDKNKSQYTKSLQWMEVLPIFGISDKILGPVGICDSCVPVFTKAMTRHYHTHGEDLQTAHHEVVRDICVKCNDAYFITHNEYDFRKKHKTYGQHVCPRCLSDYYGEERWINVPCTRCQRNSVTVDVTLLDPNYICRPCRSNQTDLNIEEMANLKTTHLNFDIEIFKVQCKSSDEPRFLIKINDKENSTYVERLSSKFEQCNSDETHKRISCHCYGSFADALTEARLSIDDYLNNI